MPVYRAQVTLRTSNNLPADYMTNTLYFDADTDAVLVDIAGVLSNMYDDFIRAQQSSLVAQNGHLIDFYRMSDPEPRAPVYSETFNYTSAPSAAGLPSEVALCISFQGDRSSGVNQARRRGRIYIGALSVASIVNARPNATLRDALRDAGAFLLAESNTDVDWTWVVFSQVDFAGVPVTNGWVDDSYDTQRRRGMAPTTRDLF